MKKIILISTILVVLFAGSVVTANVATQVFDFSFKDIIPKFEKTPTAKDELITIEPEIEPETEDAIYEINNSFTSYLKQQGDRYEVTGELEKAYRVFQSYSITDSNATYITNLVKEGYDVSWLLDLYSFWTTCDEDIELIKTMYDKSESENLTGRFWEEDAFNYATNFEHGELSLVDIQSYMKKGLEITEIDKANVLSRREGYSITGILDRLVEGDSIESIESEINAKIGKISASDIAFPIQNSNNYEVYTTTAEIQNKKQSNDEKIKAAIIEKIGQERYASLNEYSDEYIYNACIYSEKTNETPERILSGNRGTGKYEKILEKVVYML